MKTGIKSTLLVLAVTCVILSTAAWPATPTTPATLRDHGLNASVTNSSIFYHAIGTDDGGVLLNISSVSTDRLNRTISIKADTSPMLGSTGAGWTNVLKSYLNMTYPNGTSVLHNMTEIGTTNVFFFNWTTRVWFKPGVYTFRVYPENQFGANWTNFDFSTGPSVVSVMNLAPWGIIRTNTTAVFRNQSIGFNVTVFDAETPYINMQWLLRMYKGVTLVKTWQTGEDYNQTHFFNGTADALLGAYSLTLRVTDGEGMVRDAAPVNFTVQNHLPTIHAVQYNHTDDLKRATESMRFTVNASDFEDGRVASTRVWVTLQDMITKQNTTRVELAFNVTTTNYTGSVTFPFTAPFEQPHRIIVEARDRNGGITYWNASSNVAPDNNLPVINGVLVDGKPISQGHSFTQNVLVTFTLNITDVEAEINFVQLKLVHLETGSALIFHETVLQGTSVGTTFLIPITVSTAMLTTGTWHVFVYVNDFDSFDTDNQSGNFPAQGSIAVLPDLRDFTLMTFLVVLATIIGIVIGGGLLWRYANARLKDIRREMLIKGSSGKDAHKKDQATTYQKAEEIDAGAVKQAPPAKQAPAKPAAEPKPPAKPAPASKGGKKEKSRF